MKNRIHFGYKLLVFNILIIYSCAQQVPPNGGDKDTKAPKVVGSRPLNKTTNFDANKITISFDEYIQIKEPGQIIISPPMAEKPSISSNGKSVLVEFFKNRPKENTTYTINFGSAIVDNNEGNLLGNYAYVFSTGAYLDSNEFNAKALSSLKRTKEKGVTVSLYKVLGFRDSSLLKKLPDYFGKSLEDGSIKIENLPIDSFYAFCFKDENNNLKIDKAEPCAFIQNIIYTGKSAETITFNLFDPHPYKQGSLLDTLAKQKAKYQFVVYDVDEIKIKPNSKSVKYAGISKGSKGVDTINFYQTNLQDTLAVGFNIETPDTSYQIKLKTKTKAKTPSLNAAFKLPKYPHDTILIEASVPIESLDVSKLSIKCDTLLLKPKVIRSNGLCSWYFTYPYEAAKTYEINLKDSAIKSLYGQYNTALTSTFTPKTEQDFGTLSLSITNSNKQFVLLEIIEDNEQAEIVYSTAISKSAQLSLKNLNPMNYKIRFIKDQNKNGKWDTGDLQKRRMPEEVYYFENVIPVKAYWDIEQSLDLDKLLNN